MTLAYPQFMGHITDNCEHTAIATKFLDALYEPIIGYNGQFGPQDVYWTFDTKGAKAINGVDEAPYLVLSDAQGGATELQPRWGNIGAGAQPFRTLT